MPSGVVTKYYYAGSQRIAMRSNGTLFFLLGDHLGSTSLVTFGNGNVVSETRYKAWGEGRYASGTTPTDYTYTGQYSYASDFGLMFYNARWYDPSLSRFAQADPIVPQTQGVQAWDRYAYALNNPIRYIDPSGHSVDCGIGDLFCSAGKYTINGLINLYKHYYGKDALKRPYDKPNNIRERLSQEIEDFLVENPDYSGKDDRFSSNNYGLFYDIRHDYWRDRCLEGSCDAIYDPDKLYRYYDLHQGVTLPEWHSSEVSCPNVWLDAAGIPLGIYGGNVTKFGKFGGRLLQGLGIADSTASLIDAADKGDHVGEGLAFLSALPGIGAYASSVSLVRDLAQGVQQVNWYPSISR